MKSFNYPNTLPQLRWLLWGIHSFFFFIVFIDLQNFKETGNLIEIYKLLRRLADGGIQKRVSDYTLSGARNMSKSFRIGPGPAASCWLPISDMAECQLVVGTPLPGNRPFVVDKLSQLFDHGS